jgi:S-formylglutathione hydrolase FrmB
MRRFIQILTVLFLLAGTALTVNAGIVDTITTYSPAMKKNIKAVIIKPADYNKSQKYPVVYLLHGYSGNYADWLTKAPELKSYVDLYKMLIVCPDGGFGSWYFDSPADSSWRYETYLSKELVQWVDQNLSTIANRTGRAITGLSMGGHGALFLAFRHQDVFGAAGSTSGGVDIRPFPNNWDLSKRLGDYAQYPKRWDDNSVINLTYLLKPNSLALIIDCGTEDFFYHVNVALHDKLLYSNIPHDFITRPGGHNTEYWRNSVKYQLLFMSNFFSKK